MANAPLGVAAQRRRKERNWGTDVDSLALRIEMDRYGHEPVIGRQVEELVTVVPPARLDSAAG